MDIKNYSGRPLILPFNTKRIKRAVFLPDYCPTSKNPTGSAISFERKSHVLSGELLGSDVGCGMRLVDLRGVPKEDLADASNNMASHFIDNPKGLGSLGKGNHFLTFYESSSDQKTYALIHSGSRKFGIDLFREGKKGEEYLRRHDQTMARARENRDEIQRTLEKKLGTKVLLVLDLPHNFLEVTEEEVIYRKGAVKVSPGEKTVIPSSMGGKAIITQVNGNVAETMNSFCHGTGRKMSRSDAKKELFFEDPDVLNGVYFPYFLPVDHFETELPPCYRSIEDILPFVKKHSKVIDELVPIASVMI